ncbi:MAG: hypothetical protein WD136_03335 [Cyanobium sp.]
MADVPYLVALALVEFGGKRALPLCGKSWSGASSGDPSSSDPGDEGRTLALELLLRVWQRSDEAPLQRAAGVDSLLLLEIPLEALSDRLPVLKANWIGGSDTAALQAELRALALRGWRLSIAKYEPVTFTPW